MNLPVYTLLKNIVLPKQVARGSPIGYPVHHPAHLLYAKAKGRTEVPPLAGYNQRFSDYGLIVKISAVDSEVPLIPPVAKTFRVDPLSSVDEAWLLALFMLATGIVGEGHPSAT